MDRRFLTVLMVSLVFALVVAGVFYQLVAASGRGKHRAKPVETRDLVVAAHPLPLGISLKSSDVKIIQVPAAQFPAGCFSKIEEVAGRPVNSSILAEEPIRDARLAPRGSGLGLAPVIPPGMRAVSVKVNEVVGVAGFVIPGLHVDVLVTGRLPGDENPTTKTILQDVLVISAGQTIEADSKGQAINAPVVTLLVTPEQAETLTLASEWRIQLVLRNGADRKMESTRGLQLPALLGRSARSTTPVVVDKPVVAPPKPVAAAPPPKPAGPPMAEVIVIRGAQKTVEQVGVQKQ